MIIYHKKLGIMNILKGKVAIVTGGSSGLGKATILKFASEGAIIINWDLNVERGKALLDELKKMGTSSEFYRVNTADISTIQLAVTDIITKYGKIDILINNAGIGYTGNLSDTPLEDWQQVINVNLTSVFQCMMGILPGMRQQGQGTIINIASIAAKQAFAGWGAYCVSKAGLLSLSQTLAQEERANGIRVMAICPGSVNTEIWDTPTVKANFDRSQMLTPEIVAQTILHTVLLPQQAVIEELTIMSNAGVL